MADTDDRSGISCIHLTADLSDLGTMILTQTGLANVILQTQVATHRVRNTELVQVIPLALTLHLALGGSSYSCSLINIWLAFFCVIAFMLFRCRRSGKQHHVWLNTCTAP